MDRRGSPLIHPGGQKPDGIPSGCKGLCKGRHPQLQGLSDKDSTVR